MPSLAALAGRAGDWDWTDMNAAKLQKGTLLGLWPAPTGRTTVQLGRKHLDGDLTGQGSKKRKLQVRNKYASLINCIVSVKDGTAVIC